MNDIDALKDPVLAPYIIKATALIGIQRRVGGNQFRHCFSTLGILFDYKYFQDSVLLKAAVLHDLLEDVPGTEVDQIRCIEQEADQVNKDMVIELTDLIARRRKLLMLQEQKEE